MNLDSINARIKVVNTESKRLNNERQANLGRRDALRQQLDAALAQYKSKYGVELTEDMIKSELERVASEKEAEVAKLEQMIDCINRRDYAGARVLAGETEEKVEQTGSVADFAPVQEGFETQKVTQPIISSEVNSPVGTRAIETAHIGASSGYPAMVISPNLGQQNSEPKIDVPVMPNLGQVASKKQEDDLPVAPPNLEQSVQAPVMLNLGQSAKSSTSFDGVMMPPSDDDIPAPPQFGGGIGAGIGVGSPSSASQVNAGTRKVNSFSNILSGSEFNPN